MDKSQGVEPGIYPSAPTGYSGPAAPGYGQAPPSYGQSVQPQAAYTQGNVVQVQPTTVYVERAEERPSMTGHIILSCFVFWCCNWLFGCIAFFIAISGTSANTADESKRLGKTSMWVSIAGIIISVVIAIIVLILYFTGVLISYNSYDYYYN